MSLPRIQNYIDGRLVDPASGQHLDNVDPAVGEAYGLVPDSGEADVERAVSAAERASPKWSAAPAGERCRLLLKIADLLERDLDRFARAECVDTGKPLTLARTLDIPRAIANFRFFASSMLHFQSESHMTDDVALNYTLRQPRGVCGLISPWNLPLYLLSWKVAPALACGNCAVAKPSEVTPMTAFLLSSLCIEAGLPPGVLNIVHGRGATAGDAIVRHPRIRTLSFTGGTVTGAAIARTAGPMFKKLALELGGKNPNVIFADADLDEALREGTRAAFSNQGQVCLSGSRIFVERPLYAEFVERLSERARSLRVGDPLEPTTEQGALVSRAHRDKVLGYLELALKEGARVVCGGQAPRLLSERCSKGFFVEPTVLTDLGPDCRVNREEIFGPVASVMPFDTEADVLAMANAVDYGLSASIWTRDLDRAHRLAGALAAGTVWINCWLLRDLRVPFGGTKGSGVGREGGWEAIRFFTEPKNVCLRVRSTSGRDHA